MSKSSKQGTAVAVTTISLPGPPVAFTIDPKRLRAWLKEKRWRKGNNRELSYWWFSDPMHRGYEVNVPKDPHSPDAARQLKEAIVRAAEADGVSPLVLAELLQGD